jgi:hypothetical protein
LSQIGADFVFQYQRVREYWDKPDVNPPLIRDRELGVAGFVNRAKMARNSCA